MTDKKPSAAFTKIAAGLEDAIAYANGDTSRARIAARVERIQEAAEATAGHQETMAALADTERALKRIARRNAVPPEMEHVEIVQQRGPTVSFTGRLLADTSFETRRGLNMLLELFETEGGALIAVSSTTLAGGGGREDARVTIVEPQEDIQAMRLAVMDAFEYEVRARSMVKKLGWSLRVDVA